MHPDLDTMDSATALALLRWQVELGADEATGEVPVNRYEETAASVVSAPPQTEAVPVTIDLGAAYTAVVNPVTVDAVAVARVLAAGAGDLAALAEAWATFDHCELKKGARSFVFADGTPAARVMIVGEAPGLEEDKQGRPFVGKAGQLLDRMFAAIGMGREHPDSGNALYITNVLPWKPPGNRDPEAAEMAMMRPFVERHVELADPEIIVTMGRFSLNLLTGLTGITRVRGQWTEALGRPCLPMLHPAFLLRNPSAKREAWADLLALKARLMGME